MSVLSELRCEIARLELMKRRRGVVTRLMVAEALPPYLRKQATTHCLEITAKAINEALDVAADVIAAPTLDYKARASGDAAAYIGHLEA